MGDNRYNPNNQRTGSYLTQDGQRGGGSGGEQRDYSSARRYAASDEGGFGAERGYGDHGGEQGYGRGGYYQGGYDRGSYGQGSQGQSDYGRSGQQRGQGGGGYGQSGYEQAYGEGQHGGQNQQGYQGRGQGSYAQGGRGNFGGQDDYGQGYQGQRFAQQQHHEGTGYGAYGQRGYSEGAYAHREGHDDRFGSNRQQGGYGQGGNDYDYDNRGFLQRAGDEVRSWFGDEEAQRRRGYDQRYDNRDQGQDGEGDRYQGQQGGRSGGTGPTFQNGEWIGTGSGWARDDDYGHWRRRQIEALDRDYDEYRQENRQRFHGEFDSWRTERQGQRTALQRVTEHMEVVGSDGQHIGKVDKVRGDRIILTKSDPNAGGMHHSIPSRWIESVADKVKIRKTAQEAMAHWREEARMSDDERAQGSAPQHRPSESGTGSAGTSASTGSGATGSAGGGSAASSGAGSGSQGTGGGQATS